MTMTESSSWSSRPASRRAWSTWCNGGKETVDAMLDHPAVRAICFVGSTPVARYIYSRAAANGKRVQCQGGAKNPVVILPDADMEMTTRIVADSAFGCAGQRCLAASVAITVGEAPQPFTEQIATRPRTRGRLRAGRRASQMGPVITRGEPGAHRGPDRAGRRRRARPLVDGRSARSPATKTATSSARPCSTTSTPASELARTEIFGPVLSLMHADDGRRGDRASSTAAPTATWPASSPSSGAAARKFRYEASVGNIGINVGVAAPMAFFPFSGWKDSFFGDLHGQGRDAVEFYTQKKVVVERWPATWTRKF